MGSGEYLKFRIIIGVQLFIIVCPRFPNLRAVSLRVCDFLFWREQVLCSTFCHLRVSRRFEVELAARRFGTKPLVGSPLGDLNPLSYRRMKPHPMSIIFSRPDNTDNNRTHCCHARCSPLPPPLTGRRRPSTYCYPPTPATIPTLGAAPPPPPPPPQRPIEPPKMVRRQIRRHRRAPNN
jgi:hypothetical protein